MGFRPFDVSTPHIVYAALGGFVVLFGMFSLLIREKLYIGEAPLAFAFGIVIGPYGANIFNPRSWGGAAPDEVNKITLEVTRVILAVGVFAIGVELPKQYMKRHWKSLFFLLVPVMTWGWLVSAGLIFALIPGLSFLSSLAVAACLTPTDPILAAAVVGGKYADKHVPAHLRHLLAAESGCNDGAAFPFLYLAIYLITEAHGHAVQDWFLITWLYEIVVGTIFGAVLGFGFRHLMKFCERKELIDRQSYVAQYVSLAMLTIGITTLLGSDDLLAAFSCGTAFAWDGFFNRQIEQAVFSSVIDLLFNIAAFVFIGAWMPFSSFNDDALTLSVWRLVVIALLVLLLRRLPIMLALFKWIPDVKTFREAIFSGHFGPIGVGAIFISTLAAEKLAESKPEAGTQLHLLTESIQPIVAFMVLCSITIHGLSIPFFSLGRRVHTVSRTWSRHLSTDRNAMPEWATHTRKVARPEDIVINRDDAMERGEVAGKTGEHGAPQSTLATPIKEKPSQSESSSSATYENPPDGEYSEMEWLEGDDLIVERRRRGGGEDVEVEVRHGVSTKGAKSASRTSTLRGSEEEVEAALRQLIPTWKGWAHRTARGIRQGLHDAMQPGKYNNDEPIPTSEGPPAPHSSSIVVAEDDWASEPEDETGHTSETQGDASVSTPTSPTQSPPSPTRHNKRSPTKHRISTKGARRSRRDSVRRAVLGHGYRSDQQQLQQAEEDQSAFARPSPPSSHPSTRSASPEDEGRGRSIATASGTGASTPNGVGSAPHSPRNRRIDSLRHPHGSRSVSPAPSESTRSIRFAPDSVTGPTGSRRSGTTTPRTDDRDAQPQPPQQQQKTVAFDVPAKP